MNDSYYWEHVEDTDVHCPTATLLEGKTWLCLDHGAPVTYVKLTPINELTMEQFKARKTQVITDTFDRADGSIGADWSKSGAPHTAELLHEYNVPLGLANVSQAPPGTSAHHLQEYTRPKAERARELHEQYAPMWAQVIRLAYEQQIQDEATLRQVGWFCAGGHPLPSDMHSGAAVDQPAPADLQIDNPCEYAVPVYALVISVATPATPAIDRSGDHPDVDYVKNLVGAQVRITVHSEPDTVITGKLTTMDHRDTVWVETSDSLETTIPWVDLRTCEEL